MPVDLRVILAESLIPVHSVLAWRVGSIIEFNRRCDERLLLCIGKCPIARGTAVKVGEKFGLQITAVNSVAQRIDALGG